MCRYMHGSTQWPRSPPIIRAIVVSGLSFHTVQILPRVYPFAARRRHGLPQRHTYGCTHR